MPAPRFLSALLASAALSAAAGAAQADYRLTLLHFNDFHSRFESVSKYDNTCSVEDETAGECFGGVARMKTFLDERRAALGDANVLTLSAGDMFQGSPFYSTYKGAATVEMMNQLGLDVMALGNHEFDDGPEVLSRFMTSAGFPIISGNTDVTAEPVLAGRLPGYVIVGVGGEQIAVVALLATDTDEIAAPGPNVKFEDELAYLARVVPEIEAKGVNKIIALTHVGLTRDMEIAAAAAGVDVIVGGHSHTYLSASDPKREGAYPTWVTGPTGALVPIVQAYAYSRYIGELTIDFDDDGDVIFADGDTALLDASVKPEPAIAARVAELGAPIAEAMSRVVAEAAAPIDGDRASCRARECEMGALITAAMLERAAGQGVTLAIANGGGMRASIPAGQVTMGDVLAVLPFQNTIATMKLSGAHVVEALEGGVGKVEEAAGRFPQVAGLRFAFDPAAKPGSRVTAVEIKNGDGWAPIDPAAIYGVVTNNYMRQGGDGYDTFRDHAIDPYDYGPNLEEAVATYL
ncbi:MAG: 5'-nucleotidase C-terminal domain-containing protein, partial [Paracoccaceae bacterium]